MILENLQLRSNHRRNCIVAWEGEKIAISLLQRHNCDLKGQRSKVRLIPPKHMNN